MPCAVPCDILPCSLRCEEDLACGHQCPSVCGESCPSTEFCQQCASTTVKQTYVDFGSLGTLTYQGIDLDATPVIVPACGHFILMTTMDQRMGVSDHYEVSSSGVPVAFRSESLPLAVIESKFCPPCQGPLRDLNRYNRLVKRPKLDESTKKFIVHSNKVLVPLATRLQQEETRLAKTKSTMSAGTTVVQSKCTSIVPTLVRLGGPRGVLFHNISELSGLGSRCGPLLALHHEILTFLGRVREDEQPFAEIQWTVAQRPRAMHRATVLQTTSSLLTKGLLLRCEYDILTEIIKIHREQTPRMATQHHWLTLKLCLDLDFNRRDCRDLINEAIEKSHPIIDIEARLLFAKFVALERIASIDPDRIEGLLPQARRQMEIAKHIAKNSPILEQPDSPDLEVENQRLEMELQKYSMREGETNMRCKVLDCTKLFAGAVFWRKHVEKCHPQWYEKMKASVSSSASSLLAEVKEMEKMLQEVTVSMIVTSAEKQAMYLVMAQDYEGAGRWYHCSNMHAVRIIFQVATRKLTVTQFTIENREARVGTPKCPQCGELVAGPSQEVVEEVPNAVDVEHQSRDMILSAQFELLEMRM